MSKETSLHLSHAISIISGKVPNDRNGLKNIDMRPGLGLKDPNIDSRNS